MVIVYKISLISYIIGRLIVDVKNIGIVNIIAGKTIVPELIQSDASGKRIAEEALSILKNGERKKEMIKELDGNSRQAGRTRRRNKSCANCLRYGIGQAMETFKRLLLMAKQYYVRFIFAAICMIDCRRFAIRSAADCQAGH